MQIGGIGSGHDSSSHHVTNCIHEHGGKNLDSGGAVKSFTGGAQTPVWRTGGQEGEGFSLSAWLADPFKSMKKAAGKLWRGDSESGESVRGNAGSDSARGEQVLARMAEEKAAEKAGLSMAMNGNADGASQHTPSRNADDMLHTPRVAAAATAVRQPDAQNNPYFAAVADTGRERQTLMEKMKVRFESVTSFLAKKFSFSGRNSFQAKQEQPREDLRKRSHYRGEDLDIECVLTDDSYLLDSYDRKGEYSKLSAK